MVQNAKRTTRLVSINECGALVAFVIVLDIPRLSIRAPQGKVWILWKIDGVREKWYITSLRLYTSVKLWFLPVASVYTKKKMIFYIHSCYPFRSAEAYFVVVRHARIRVVSRKLPSIPFLISPGVLLNAPIQSLIYVYTHIFCIWFPKVILPVIGLSCNRSQIYLQLLPQATYLLAVVM